MVPAEEPDATRPCVVLSTVPDAEVGQRLARTLVERRLAACVNLLPGATSVYRWQGAIEEAHETLLVIKTASHRLAELERALIELHPYEVPELVALDLSAAEARYAAWLVDATR